MLLVKFSCTLSTEIFPKFAFPKARWEDDVDNGIIKIGNC